LTVDHNDGYLEPVNEAYCEILDDTSGSDVISGAIASHQNHVLSVAEPVNCLSSTLRSNNVDVMFHNTDSEQIVAYHNDLSSGIAAYDNNSEIIAAYDNNADIRIYDKKVVMQNHIYQKVSAK
jgi:hypothetical protein